MHMSPTVTEMLQVKSMWVVLDPLGVKFVQMFLFKFVFHDHISHSFFSLSIMVSMSAEIFLR